MTLSQMLNPFDVLAELDDAGSGGDDACMAACPEPTMGPQLRASPPATARAAYKATLYVHDSSNQRACCLAIPALSLASTGSLTQFLRKRGLSLPPASLLTAHEDRVPCNLHIVPMAPMADDVPILAGKALAADCILHLFTTQGTSPSSLLQSFANVHPECFRTLADCAQQPAAAAPSGGAAVPVALDTYLEAAFEASVHAGSILYNDRDERSLSAEWCVWNTGLLWKEDCTHGGGGGSGYIFLFFKRSLSRVCRDRLSAFPMDCPRRAKPWTMNRPKPVSNVTQWLNGAPVPPPPPAEVVAAVLLSRRQAVAKPVLIAGSKAEDSPSPHPPCTPTISERTIGQSSDLAPTEGSISVPDAARAPWPSPRLPRLSLVAHSPPSSPPSTAASTPTSQQSCRSSPSLGTSGSKAAKHRRRRRRTNPKKAATSPEASGPDRPEAAPEAAPQKEMEARIDELVAALQQARCAAVLQACGWISGMGDPSPAGPSSATAGSWATGQLDWVL